MKITEVTVFVLEIPGRQPMFELVELPGMARERWIHSRRFSPEPTTVQVMRVETDEGIEGVCTVTQETLGPLTERTLEQLKLLVVGQNPLDRERLYQKLHTGTRWIYQSPGWAGAFDNCLWDIAGKAANMPVYALLGRVRDSIPAYFNIRGETKEEAAKHARYAVSEGFVAVKDHFYHSIQENIEWFEAIRDAVGRDIDIMHDAVAIYTFEEAIRVGRALEALNYRWFEEPLSDRQQNKLKALCDALDIPILALEMMMNEVDLQAQWLISGATDMIRVNARHGTTPLMKLAHLAELYGTTVELNGVGGNFGLVHTHLLCSIYNTSFYEYWGGTHEQSGREIGMTNPPSPIKGRMAPPDGPGWGAAWDWELFQNKVIAEI